MTSIEAAKDDLFHLKGKSRFEIMTGAAGILTSAETDLTLEELNSWVHGSD